MECFPSLAASADPLVHQMLGGARTVTLAEDTHVFHAGDSCSHYLLALSGSIRVQLMSANAREVTLYRVKTGNSCILTTSCLLSGEHYPAEGIAESAVTALSIDRHHFQQAIEQSPVFCRFVFTSFAQRLADVIRRMEDLMFAPIDARLMELLLEAQARGALTAVTHHALAVELGTAREVVSRHLKRFEAQGWLHLGRGQIEITADGLQHFRGDHTLQGLGD
jgi:CRP/FNR family transcriptional regulator, anaerobic regulatory protein